MNGTISRTPGGNTRSDIKTIRRSGEKRYIWKKKSSLAKRNFSGWNAAVKKAKANIKKISPNYFKIKDSIHIVLRNQDGYIKKLLKFTIKHSTLI